MGMDPNLCLSLNVVELHAVDFAYVVTLDLNIDESNSSHSRESDYNNCLVRIRRRFLNPFPRCPKQNKVVFEEKVKDKVVPVTAFLIVYQAGHIFPAAGTIQNIVFLFPAGKSLESFKKNSTRK